MIVLHVVDEDKYTDDVQREVIRGERMESIEQVIEDAKQIAQEIVDAELTSEINYKAIGKIGRLPDTILSKAENRDCDHVFIADRRRSPTGKVVLAMYRSQ